MKRRRRDHPSSSPFTSEEFEDVVKRGGPTDKRFYVIMDRYGSGKRTFYVIRWFDHDRRMWRSERLHRSYQDSMNWAWRKERQLQEKMHGQYRGIPYKQSFQVLARFPYPGSDS